LRAEGFYCNLDGSPSHGGLGIKKIAIFEEKIGLLSKKNYTFFRCKMLKILVIKTPDPDPFETNADPQHCFYYFFLEQLKQNKQVPG
jgi:hypothetical protein